MLLLARPSAISVPRGPLVVTSIILLVASSLVPSAGCSINIVPCRPFIILPPGGRRPGATIIVVGATRRGSRSVAAIWSPVISAVVTVISVAIITRRTVIARRAILTITIVTTVVVRSATRIVQGNTNRSSAKVLAIQVFDGAVRIIPAEILKNAVTREVTINVRKGDAAGLTSEIFQILPASVSGDARYNQTDPGRPAGAGWAMASVVIIVATWTTLLCKLDNNVGSHKRLSIKVRHSILSILGALKFDESKA
jgi:hypothetical protein